MKVRIDTIQCRRLYERLRSGRSQLEQALRDVRHAQLHLRTQTCPAQIQALRQAERAIAVLEEELERTAFRLSQIAGTYEMYEQSVQSQLRQLPADTLFRPHGTTGGLATAELLFATRAWIFRISEPRPFLRTSDVLDTIWATPTPMRPIPRQYRLPEVPARIQDILDARIMEPKAQWFRGLPVPLMPALLLALPGDAAPQPWLTDAVLRLLQAQNEFSRTEDENEQI